LGEEYRSWSFLLWSLQCLYHKPIF
jgi:hypothetical protein